MEEKTLRMVFGYLPNIDRLDKTAVKLGLCWRVAIVVMDSDIPHTPFYWRLIESVLTQIRHDRVVFETFETTDGALVFDSLHEMREGISREFNTPFERAMLLTQEKTICLIQIEPYAMHGGPAPYHDSWTFAVYQEHEDAVGLREACYRACKEHGVEILEEEEGFAAPKISLWKRVMDFLSW